MSGPLRIVSYNVRYFGHALRGLASTRKSKQGIALGLSALTPRPQVICLQEVETESLRSTLASGSKTKGETQLEAFMGEFEQAFAARGEVCPYEAFYFRAHTYRLTKAVNVYTTGLAILVDVTAVKVEAHNVAAPQHITHHHILQVKDRKQTRICAHMRLLDPGGKPFHVFNTHMSLPTPFAKGFWTQKDKMGFGPNQLEEARSVATFVKKSAGADPFVICGDFNSPPGSPVYRYLTEEAKLTAAQEVLKQTDQGLPRGFPTAGFMRLRMHLDHLFSGAGVRWVDLKDTRPFGDLASPFHGLSDHAPLIGGFRLER